MNKITQRAAITLAVALMVIPAAVRAGETSIVDMTGLRSTGLDWQVVGIDDSPAGLTLGAYQDQWFMYFLHWRPLTEERRRLTHEYMTDLLLNFWGEDMPFEIAGNGGEIRVAGHNGRFIDGTIWNGAIRTRFIVWNCPETNRQLIADCNINVAKGTRRQQLRTQFDITEHLACHGQPIADRPETFLPVTYDRFGLEFFIPPAWRTHEYVSPAWYPEGTGPELGSLWTLPTDSQKFFVLTLSREKKATDESALKAWLDSLRDKDLSAGNRVEMRIAGISTGPAVESDKLLVARAGVTMASTYRGETSDEPYSCVAVSWRDGDATYFLLAGLVAMADVWDIPTDLRPDDDVLLDFVRAEILANIPAFQDSNIQFVKLPGVRAE